MVWKIKRLTTASRAVQKLGENIFLLLALLWMLLWVFPWASWLGSNWIRLGISILIIAAPGMVISMFLAGKRLTLTSHFTSGLAISIFLVGLLGLLGRIFQLPFDFVKYAFAFVGLIALLVFAKLSRSGYQWYEPKGFSITTPILLLFAIILGVLVSFRHSPFGGDDFSYLAYLTNWQHAQPLDFQEVIFGSGNSDHIRFWLAMLPMTWALLAEISGLHGLLLLGFYLEPYLIAIAVLAAFNLYEDFLQSKYLPIAALLLQFTFLFLLSDIRQPGQTFFARLSEDKAFAAFILAPVFFIAVRYFLESFTLKSAIFNLTIGLSLAVTHPVILAYSIFIAGVFAGIVTVARRDYKKLVFAILLLAFTIFPSASLRFIDAPSAPSSFDLDSALNSPNIDTRISYIMGTPFYGFNIDKIQVKAGSVGRWEGFWQIFFSWSYLWILVIGFLWSLFNLRRNFVAPFIAASSLLVLLCAMPFTGWLFGYFVTARMLWRTPWLLPMGLISAVLLAALFESAWRKLAGRMNFRISAERVTLGLVLTLCFVFISYFSVSVYKTNWLPTTELVDYRDSLARLSSLGNYIEYNVEQPSTFVASAEMMMYLPGLSSKSKVGLFRNERYSRIFISDPMDFRKIKPVLSSAESASFRQRLDILRNSHVKYILVDDPSIMRYYDRHAKFFKIEKAADFWIIEFVDTDY